MRTSWFDAKKYKPSRRGWYVCNMEKGNWTFGEGFFGFWDGKRWLRPSGWPSSHPQPFELHEGLLKVELKGLFEPVEILQFQGLKGKPAGQPYNYEYLNAPPANRIWNKAANRLEIEARNAF